MTKEEQKAYKLGAFAAYFLIDKGAIQPDFQLANVGERNGVYTFVDFADIEFFNLPDDLTTDVVRKIKESILSLADNFEGDFILQSYLRAGFVSKTGLLGHMVYEDARDNYYSSFLFLDKAMISTAHSLYRITKWCDVKTEIGEWLSLPWKGEQEHMSIEPISPINRYYLNMMLLTDSLIAASTINNTQKEFEIITQIAVEALNFDMPYTAYGLASKIRNSAYSSKFNQAIDMIVSCTKNAVEEFKVAVDKHINLDIVELMWFLEDLDITLPRKS